MKSPEELRQQVQQQQQQLERLQRATDRLEAAQQERLWAIHKFSIQQMDD